MKLNVGDYVRTYNGLIGKIKLIVPVDETHNCYYFKNIQPTYDINIKLAKEELIDLIEIGDYVNGMKVIDIVENDIYISDFYAESYIGLVKVKDIKSIVTKEQFESVEYRLED